MCLHPFIYIADGWLSSVFINQTNTAGELPRHRPIPEGCKPGLGVQCPSSLFDVSLSLETDLQQTNSNGVVSMLEVAAGNETPVLCVEKRTFCGYCATTKPWPTASEIDTESMSWWVHRKSGRNP